MEDKIDVHHRDLNYQRAMEKLEANTSMNPKDKELILKFVWDCKLGKTKTGKRNKKVGKARIMKYVMNLRSLSRWVGKPFDEVEQKDMEKLVLGIEEDIHKNREKKYSDET
ncbi:MAG: hypothetical protein L6408_07125, partial [Nanoarchaeota archaeon]|nr:hypothetical protein [Nanoarchaeota archaeon]